MTRRDVQRRLLDGDWVEVQPDVFACAGTPLTHAAHCWAGVLTVGPPVALGRRSAAMLLRLDRAPVPPDEEPDLVVPENRDGYRLRAPARLRRMRPSRFNIVYAQGLPVTPAPLALRELGMVIPRDWLRDMASHALRRRIVTFSGLSTQLGRGWPGAASLRDVLREVAPGYQVVWEGVLHRALTAAGLLLEPQVPVPLDDGREALLDLGSKRLRFGVEVDGLASHLDRFAGDLRRDRALRRAGWHIEHVAVPELTDDLDGVVRDVLVAATLRAHQLGTTLSELRGANRTA
jgi:very-short-patch-repair endonuclease